MVHLLVLAVGLAIASRAEEILNCGTQPYYPSQYTCYDGFLCPIINNEPSLKCADACYLPEQYTCNDGTLSITPPPQSNAFTIRALQTIDEIEGRPINACGQSFIVGPKAMQSCTYCPETVARSGLCAALTNTTIIAGGSSFLVEVPGGQQMFVTPDFDPEPSSLSIPGRLGFTQAHSAYQPPSASSALAVRELGRGERSYIYTGPGATPLGGQSGSGWVACPTEPGVWQIFARIQGQAEDERYVQGNCVGLEIGVEGVNTADGYGAWQFV